MTKNLLRRIGSLEGIWVEALVAAFLVALFGIYCILPLINAPDTAYPFTVDGLGHLAKIKYLADSLRLGEWPSWFPYWYSGSTVMQYYPPLSYVLLAPIQLFFDNLMMTYRVFVFSTQFIGAMGVWYICRCHIGKWVGVPAALVYTWQPFLLRSLLLSGVVAQGPIFALTPWAIAVAVHYCYRGGRASWLLSTLCVSLLILSHAMHAVLVTICVGLVLLVLWISKKVHFATLWGWAVSVLSALFLTAFWWLPGVTQLETPGVPYLLPEAAVAYTATLQWFWPSSRWSTSFYFSLTTVVLAVTGALLYQRFENRPGLIYPFVASFLASLFLSGGTHLPFIKHIPMSESIVFGRVLSVSSALGSVLVGAALGAIHKYCLNLGYRLGRSLTVCLLILLATLIDCYPHVVSTAVSDCSGVRDDLSRIIRVGAQEGRFSWLYPASSDITLFPMLYGLRMADGWNIEGTPHNRAVWQHNIALATNCEAYVARNLLEWNVRSLIVDRRYSRLHACLTDLGFETLHENPFRYLMVSKKPSSYLMSMDRDSMAIGLAAREVVMHFPWFLEGRSPALEDYRPDELRGIRLLYLAEPRVYSISEFERRVTEISNSGTVVVIEPGRAEIWPILGVLPFWTRIQSNSTLIPSIEGPIKVPIALKPDPSGQAAAFDGLDGVWYSMESAAGVEEVIGYKQLSQSRMYFVGLSLGQSLSYDSSNSLHRVLEAVLDTAHPNKTLAPSPFPVSDLTWRYDGLDFAYSSSNAERIWASITYSPRWKVTVSGKPVQTMNHNNLLLFDAPPGQHTVSLTYGTSWVALLGIAVSATAAVITIIWGLYGVRKSLIALTPLR